MEVPKSAVTLRNQALVSLSLIAVGVLFRLVPHEPNFVPVGAVALAGGVLLSWRLALCLPLGIMVVSDLFIGAHSGMVFTWLGFALVALWGTAVRKLGFLKRLAFGVAGTSLIFFAVSNFGVWLTSGMYVHSLGGLVECYVMGIPFLRVSFLADAVYGLALLGGYELVGRMAESKTQTLRISRAEELDRLA